MFDGVGTPGKFLRIYFLTNEPKIAWNLFRRCLTFIVAGRDIKKCTFLSMLTFFLISNNYESNSRRLWVSDLKEKGDRLLRFTWL